VWLNSFTCQDVSIEADAVLLDVLCHSAETPFLDSLHHAGEVFVVSCHPGHKLLRCLLCRLFLAIHGMSSRSSFERYPVRIPNGVLNVVKNFDSSSRITFQYPDLASSFLKTLSLLSYGSTSSSFWM